jgi:hypothetical protein
MSNTLTVTREVRGTSHWVHVTGPITLDRKAPYKAAAEARKWAREKGMARAFRLSGGGSYNSPESGGEGTFRYSVSYGFER